MGDSSFIPDKRPPSTSFHGGLLGVCDLANLIQAASPVKLYHERTVVRLYDQHYGF
jgi:hypothetical protein